MQGLISLSDLKKLFEKTKKQSNNFDLYADYFLREKPDFRPCQSVLIFRLGLGISKGRFAKLLGISYRTLTLMEGNSKKVKKLSTSSKYVEKLSKYIRPFLWGDILRGYKKWLKNIRKVQKNAGKRGGNIIKNRYGIKYYKKISTKGARNGGLTVRKRYGTEHYREMGLRGGHKGGLKGGITSARIFPLTEQERRFLKTLLKKQYTCFWIFGEKTKIFTEKKEIIIKTSRLKDLLSKEKICEIHPVIDVGRKIIPDFAIYENGKPKNIIESMNTRERHSNYLDAVNIIERKKLLAKKSMPLIAIVSFSTPVYSFLRLLEECFVCCSEDIHILLDLLEIQKLEEINKITCSKLAKRETTKSTRGIHTCLKSNPSRQEKRIQKLLKSDNINFEFNYPLTNSLGSKHFADFVIFKNGKPKIVIEVTHVERNSYRALIMGALRLWNIIDYSKRFYEPDAYYIGILTNKKELEIPEVSKIGSTFDAFITNNNLKELPKVIADLPVLKNKKRVSDREIIDMYKASRYVTSPFFQHP